MTIQPSFVGIAHSLEERISELPFIFSSLSALSVADMEFKCLLETRGESVSSESAAKLMKLSECRDNVDDQLQTWHLSKLKGTAQEYELIVNRSGLLHDLSSDQFERLWICEKH